MLTTLFVVSLAARPGNPFFGLLAGAGESAFTLAFRHSTPPFALINYSRILLAFYSRAAEQAVRNLTLR